MIAHKCDRKTIFFYLILIIKSLNWFHIVSNARCAVCNLYLLYDQQLEILFFFLQIQYTNNDFVIIKAKKKMTNKVKFILLYTKQFSYP